MDLFAKTPPWVYLVFVFLVCMGLRALRPRTIHFRRLILLPSLFTVWNIVWLAERLQGHFFLFIFWGVGLLIGVVIGWQVVSSWQIKAYPAQKRISLPGSGSTLLFILLVFLSRYFFVYNYEVYPESAAHLFKADALISGAITGVFIGQVLELYRKYKRELL